MFCLQIRRPFKTASFLSTRALLSSIILYHWTKSNSFLTALSPNSKSEEFDPDEDDVKCDGMHILRRTRTLANQQLMIYILFSLTLRSATRTVPYHFLSDAQPLSVLSNLCRIRCMEVWNLIASSSISIYNSGSRISEIHVGEGIYSCQFLSGSTLPPDFSVRSYNDLHNDRITSVRRKHIRFFE